MNLFEKESFDNIKWYENVISKADCMELYANCFKKPNWSIQFSVAENLMDRKNPNNPFWIFLLDKHDQLITKIFNSVRSSIGSSFEIDRCYINGQSTLQDGSIHLDDAKVVDGKERYTFLIYINPVWDITWGGCTVFLNQYLPDENQRIKFFSGDDHIKSIRFLPKPNCGILFPSNYLHFAEAPTKNFIGIRMTLAFKLIKVK